MKLFNGILSSIFTVALTISAPLSANANQASDHSNQKGKDNHNREKSSLLVVDDGYKNLKFLSSEARYLSKGQSIENGSFEADRNKMAWSRSFILAKVSRMRKRGPRRRTCRAGGL